MVRKFVFFCFSYNMVTGPSVSPPNPEYMLIKWIVVAPGDALDLFQVCDEVVRLVLEDIPDVQFSEKDTDCFQFLFDYTDEINFKCFSDCKYVNGASYGPYWDIYQVGYLAVKLPNQWVKETLLRSVI